jgi:outer membrane protein assembly factor BamB
MGTALRRAWVRWFGPAAVCGVLLAAGCGSGGEDGGDGRTAGTEATARGPEWGMPNADRSNTRRVDSALDASNVRRLRVAWRLPLRGMHAATPVVVDGVAYTADLMSNVYAIDLASGRLKWRTDYELGDTGPNGVSVAGGRVFAVTPSDAMALDADTGRQLWSTTLVREGTGELIVMTPGHDDGLVYVSTVPTVGGDLGTLWALDASSGRRRWGWEQGPRDLWGNTEVNGAGGMWHPPAFDDEGALYISIADPTPWPGTEEQPWGRSRPGPNKWSNSLVKLDARTGRFIWGRQVLPHDFYDWDLQLPPILATVDGRDVVLAAGKMGFVFAFDRETGELLWKRSVGIHNGHDNDSRRAMRGDYSNIGYGRKLYPGDWGGVQTQMASDGRTVYVPVNNLYAIFRRQTLPDMQDPIKGTGEMVALDIATGRVKWVRKLPHGAYGGASITNDLVFTTSYEGTVWALNRDSGAVEWKAPLPAASIGPVSITGDTVLSAGAITLDPGHELELVAFRLDGASEDG